MSDSDDSLNSPFSDSSDEGGHFRRRVRRRYNQSHSDDSTSSSSSSSSDEEEEDEEEVAEDPDMPELEAAPPVAPAGRRVAFGSPNPDENDGEGDPLNDNWFALQARRRGRGEIPSVDDARQAEGRPPIPGSSRAPAGGTGMGRFVAGERRRPLPSFSMGPQGIYASADRPAIRDRAQWRLDQALPFPLDPARPRGGFGSSAPSAPARPSHNAPSRAAPTAASRPPQRGRRHSVVDLTALSSDDDMDVIDRPSASRARRVADAAGHAAQAVQLTRAALEDLEGRLAQRDQEARDRERARQEARRIIDNPAEAQARPRIRLGGAVLQQGARRVQFAPGEPARRRANPELDIEASIGRARRPPVIRDVPVPPGAAETAAAPGGYAQWVAHQGRHVLRIANYLAGGHIPVAGMADDEDQAGGAHPIHARAAQLQLLRAQMMGRPHPPPIDVAAVIAGIQPNPHPDSLPHYSNNFDLDSLRPIELNENDEVVKSKKKMGLVCFVCHERLRLSASYRNEDDRVWALRCGHLLDQKCLVKLSTPTTQVEIDSVQPPYVVIPLLDAPPPKGKKRKVAPKLVKEPTREYGWKCPAKGCGRDHRSVKMPEAEGWAQVAGYGAYQAYM